eukprot:CAMPEP_0117691364 /NCGR_PEP_ID=MMETSP0804-20121206/25680_1 /TAXON_ID=1074897 /ORGANISM="Tetraselmis astigmatica, Strain CCMP880" /LENGTH=64 /DNA_ID=CAMNT_0005504591 /DNA_START=312 /DNA_END=506 /DNA_ORIENTATION=+
MSEFRDVQAALVSRVGGMPDPGFFGPENGCSWDSRGTSTCTMSRRDGSVESPQRSRRAANTRAV